MAVLLNAASLSLHVKPVKIKVSLESRNIRLNLHLKVEKQEKIKKRDFLYPQNKIFKKKSVTLQGNPVRDMRHIEESAFRLF